MERQRPSFYTAVTLNSIRQGYVAPTTEPTIAWAGTVVGLVGLATATVSNERHNWRRKAIGAKRAASIVVENSS